MVIRKEQQRMEEELAFKNEQLRKKDSIITDLLRDKHELYDEKTVCHKNLRSSLKELEQSVPKDDKAGNNKYLLTTARYMLKGRKVWAKVFGGTTVRGYHKKGRFRCKLIHDLWTRIGLNLGTLAAASGLYFMVMRREQQRMEEELAFKNEQLRKKDSIITDLLRDKHELYDEKTVCHKNLRSSLKELEQSVPKDDKAGNKYLLTTARRYMLKGRKVWAKVFGGTTVRGYHKKGWFRGKLIHDLWTRIGLNLGTLAAASGLGLYFMVMRKEQQRMEEELAFKNEQLRKKDSIITGLLRDKHELYDEKTVCHKNLRSSLKELEQSVPKDDKAGNNKYWWKVGL